MKQVVHGPLVAPGIVVGGSPGPLGVLLVYALIARKCTSQRQPHLEPLVALVGRKHLQQRPDLREGVALDLPLQVVELFLGGKRRSQRVDAALFAPPLVFNQCLFGKLGYVGDAVGASRVAQQLPSDGDEPLVWVDFDVDAFGTRLPSVPPTDYVYAGAGVRHLDECTRGNRFVGELLSPIVDELAVCAEHIVQVEQEVPVRDCVAQPGVVRRVMLERVHGVGVRAHSSVVLRGFHGPRAPSMGGRVVWHLPAIFVAPHEPPLFLQHVVGEVELLGLALELDDFHSCQFLMVKKRGAELPQHPAALPCFRTRRPLSGRRMRQCLACRPRAPRRL